MAGRCVAADHELRAEIVARARGWLGTPYRHQASCRGVGTDCLGLVRGLWREIHGAEPEAVPAYTPGWSELFESEPLMAAAGRNLIALDDPVMGDVLMFRMRDRGAAKHLAILVSDHLERGRIIHAYTGHGVVETVIALPWYRRLVGGYRFPMRGV